MDEGEAGIAVARAVEIRLASDVVISMCVFRVVSAAPSITSINSSSLSTGMTTDTSPCTLDVPLCFHGVTTHAENHAVGQFDHHFHLRQNAKIRVIEVIMRS